MEDQTQGSDSFPSASVCVVFCFHGDINDGGSTEAETETEEKRNLPFLPSLTVSFELILPLAFPFIAKFPQEKCSKVYQSLNICNG